jgi:glucokinase
MMRRLLLGIEIGGTKLQLGVGYGDGVILDLERRAVEPENGAEGVRAQILAAAGALIARSTERHELVEAVGVGFGGPVDTTHGVVTTSHQIADWDGFPLAEWLSSRLVIPRVTIQNDADTAGLGEARFGAGAGLSPVFYVTVGSGIGGGLIINGRIYRGAGAGAAEIGHLWIWDPRSCKQQRLEDIASGWAIARAGRAVVATDAASDLETGMLFRLSGGEPSRVTGEVVVNAALEKDPVATAILAHATRAVALGLAHVVTLLAPRRVILGGGVSAIPDRLWLNPIRERLAELVFVPFRNQYDVVTASLGEEVVVHGALALAADLSATP